jgi:hypothetical protein
MSTLFPFVNKFQIKGVVVNDALSKIERTALNKLPTVGYVVDRKTMSVSDKKFWMLPVMQ